MSEMPGLAAAGCCDTIHDTLNACTHATQRTLHILLPCDVHGLTRSFKRLSISESFPIKCEARLIFSYRSFVPRKQDTYSHSKQNTLERARLLHLPSTQIHIWCAMPRACLSRRGRCHPAGHNCTTRLRMKNAKSRRLWAPEDNTRAREALLKCNPISDLVHVLRVRWQPNAAKRRVHAINIHQSATHTTSTCWQANIPLRNFSFPQKQACCQKRGLPSAIYSKYQNVYDGTRIHYASVFPASRAPKPAGGGGGGARYTPTSQPPVNGACGSRTNE